MAQASDDWPLDTPSLILEMKRRAGVRTDTELAKVLHTTQSNVSTWRKRGVPQKVLLGFNDKVSEAASERTVRYVAARAIAMRLADFWYSRTREAGGVAGRWVFYSAVALGFGSIVQQIEAEIAERERRSGRWAMEIASELIDDTGYLHGLADWLAEQSLSDLSS